MPPVLSSPIPRSALPATRQRGPGRLAATPDLLAALAARLTGRDRWLLRMLHEHRVLTTTQIAQLAFGTTRAATARLLTLYQHQAVDRFRPLAPAGSAPWHFVLGPAGAHVLTAEDAITTAQLGYRRDRALATPPPPRRAPPAPQGPRPPPPARLPPRPPPGVPPSPPPRPHHRRQQPLYRAGRVRPGHRAGRA